MTRNQDALAVPRYRSARFGGATDATLERRPNGSAVLRSTEPLHAPAQRLTDRLEHWAAHAPDRTFVARRARDGSGSGDWQRIGYAQMLDRGRRVGAALLGRGLSAERPILILSENDLEHLTLALAAMWVGIPHAPVSPAYSLVSSDFAKLRPIVDTLTPGLVFASSPACGRAIDAVLSPEVPVLLTEGRLPGGRRWDSTSCSASAGTPTPMPWPISPTLPNSSSPRARPSCRKRSSTPSGCCARTSK